MKTYNEILKDIEKARKALKTAEDREKEIKNKLFNAPDFITRKEIKQEHAEELKKVSEKITDLNITTKLLNNNAKIALFNEITPVIIEILKKYSGKPYGEKTRHKISDEIKEKTGCTCYITNRYTTSELKIYPGMYSREITAGTTENIKIINENNKIQAVEPEQIKLYYINQNYFEDIPKAIKEMKKAYKKAVEKQKELETICSEFNFYAVDGIEHIYSNKTLYSEFRG